MAKKVNTTESIAKAAGMSDAELERRIQKAFADAPREVVRLPRDPLNPDVPLEAGVNGYFFSIPRGVPVSLPGPLIEVLENASELY